MTFASSRTIGLFTNGFWHSLSVELWRGVRDAAKKHDINLISFLGNEIGSEVKQEVSPASANGIYELASEDRLDGLIIWTGALGNFISGEELQKFCAGISPIPVLCVGREIEGLPCIDSDEAMGVRSLMAHFIEEHGFTRIMFIRGPGSHEGCRIRYKAYVDALAEFGIPFDPDLVTPAMDGWDDIERQYKAYVEGSDVYYRPIDPNFLNMPAVGNLDPNSADFLELLRARKLIPGRDFQAIIGATDVCAALAIRRLQSVGIFVPKDIAAAGGDGSEEAVDITPILLNRTSISLYAQGYKAIEAFADSLDGKADLKSHTVPTVSETRMSCSCLTKTIEKAGRSLWTGVSIEENRRRLSAEIKRILGGTSSPISAAFSDSLLESFFAHGDGDESKDFLLTIGSLLPIAKMKAGGIDPSWMNMLSIVREFVLALLPDERIERSEATLRQARTLIDKIERSRLELIIRQRRNQTNLLFEITQFLISRLNIKEFTEELARQLPRIDIDFCCISLYEDPRNLKAGLRCIFAMDGERIALPPDGIRFGSGRLVPDDLIRERHPHSFVIEALYYYEEQIGIVVFKADPSVNERIYDFLRGIMSISIKSANVVENLEIANDRLSIAQDSIMDHVRTIDQRTSELEELNGKLSRLDNLKNEFIANITHDFRSPLTAILNVADLALRFNDGLDDENRENYGVIYKASLRLKSSIDKLLELAKMDAHGIKLKVREVRLVSFIHMLLDFYSSSVIGSGIRIVRNLPSREIGDFYTDSEKVQEVLDNLIGNAIKFVDHKKGIITCGLEEKDGAVAIRVSDNGIGIPTDKLETIFDRFEQVHNGRDSPYRGTGIGLAFAKQLVGYLKGKIWAESEGEGKGAQFIVELPKGRHVFDEKDFHEEEIRQRSHQEEKYLIESDIQIGGDDGNVVTIFTDLDRENFTDYKKAVLLVIDDDRNVRDIVVKYLKHNGYKNFIVAADGKLGLEAVYEHAPDLIICDYNMPNMKGDAFHDELIENPKYREIPFIFLSAIADEKVILERREKGARAYMKKPIEEKLFMITVEETLRKYYEYQRISRLATIDELTDLHNRRAVIAALNHVLAFRRYRDLSLIFFDLDDFKLVNDEYGHQAGDKLLAAIGAVIKTSIREYDTAGRYGGDEFLVVLPDTNLGQAMHVAEAIRSRIMSAGLRNNGGAISATASFGVVSLKENAGYLEKALNIEALSNVFDVEDPNLADWIGIAESKSRISEALLKMADTALYRAKNTLCRKCGFDGTKGVMNDKCPKCGSGDLEPGRNKIVAFTPE